MARRVEVYGGDVSEDPESDKTKALRKATRRARWVYEDARRAESQHAGQPESMDSRLKRVSERSAELSGEATSRDAQPATTPESPGDEADRVHDEEEIERELGEG